MSKMTGLMPVGVTNGVKVKVCTACGTKVPKRAPQCPLCGMVIAVFRTDPEVVQAFTLFQEKLGRLKKVC